jgi:hypothetical protein
LIIPASEPCWGYCYQEGTGTEAKIGEPCSASVGCGKTANNVQLRCYNKKCQAGGWADSCANDTHCNTQNGFYCNDISDTCSKINAQAFQNCMPSKSSACASGLKCREAVYANDDLVINFNGAPVQCPNDGDGDIDFSICAPITYSIANDDLNSRLVCDCDDNSECPPADQFCNEEGDNYCSRIISGARCDPEANQDRYEDAGYTCNTSTNILFRVNHWLEN